MQNYKVAINCINEHEVWRFSAINNPLETNSSIGVLEQIDFECIAFINHPFDFCKAKLIIQFFLFC